MIPEFTCQVCGKNHFVERQYVEIAFSYTLLDTFHHICELKAYHTYVLKDIPYVEGPDQKAGKEAEAAVKRYLQYGAALPPELEKNKPVLDKLPKPGRKLAFNIKMGRSYVLEPVDYFKGKPFFRSEPDLIVYSDDSDAAFNIDFKNGKPRDNYLQHAINSFMIFSGYPRLNEIKAANLYLKQGKLGEVFTFKRADNGAILAKVQGMANAARDVFERKAAVARPGPLCNWCDVKSCFHNPKH